MAGGITKHPGERVLRGTPSGFWAVSKVGIGDRGLAGNTAEVVGCVDERGDANNVMGNFCSEDDDLVGDFLGGGDKDDVAEATIGDDDDVVEVNIGEDNDVVEDFIGCDSVSSTVSGKPTVLTCGSLASESIHLPAFGVGGMDGSRSNWSDWGDVGIGKWGEGGPVEPTTGSIRCVPEQ